MLHKMTLKTIILCFTAYVTLFRGCYGTEETTVKNVKDLKDTFNDITAEAEKAAKEIGIQRPEDIPEVADWIEQCKKKVGNRSWRIIRTSPKRMMDCVSKFINFEKIKIEVEDSMKRGELDLVFKKYCKRREQVMSCVDDILENVKPCLNDQQLNDLNITRRAVDAAIDFICFENGDRIALFMAEEGVDCVQNNTDKIKTCIENEIPEVKEAEKNPQSMKIDQFLINTENCKKLRAGHACIVSSTTSCDDPTPSNILDSLIKQALKVTPCSENPPRAINSSSGFYRHFWALLPHFLTIVVSGLTAAQILL